MDAFLIDEILFEIPVYRLSPEERFREFDEGVEKDVAKAFQDPLLPGRSKEEERDWIRRIHSMRFGRPWLYNEMIGVIRLYHDGGAIKAQLRMQDHRRFAMNFSPYPYVDAGRLFEMHHGPTALISREIYDQLLDHLETASTQPPLKRRYLDLHAFRRVGPHTDWAAVLGWQW